MSQSLSIAVLTISDTRTLAEDSSGDMLVTCLSNAGHTLGDRSIVVDDKYRIRSQISLWIADPSIHCILTTGGTGFSGRDNTPEAIEVLFDQTIVGFGELFRTLSYEEIGSSTVQSRAFAGIANHTGIFCLPGSPGACRLGWEKILVEQLDSTHRPCNFVTTFQS